MNLSALSQIEKDDVLGRIGLRTEPSTAAAIGGTLASFGIGVLVGAGLGLLLAPKSGPSLREDLRERLRKAPEDLKSALSFSTPDSETPPLKDVSASEQA